MFDALFQKISDLVTHDLMRLHDSRFIGHVVRVGEYFLIFLAVILVLFLTTFFIRIFFKRHPVVNRAHRVLIYILTMGGVFALVLAGVLGLFLPVIPGIPLLLAGLFLMRKYHKIGWIERGIAYLKKQTRKVVAKAKKKRMAAVQQNANKGTEKQKNLKTRKR